MKHTVKFKKSSTDQNAKWLSRAPMQPDHIAIGASIGNEFNQICIQTVFHISSEVITYQTIKDETSKNPVLYKLV